MTPTTEEKIYKENSTETRNHIQDEIKQFVESDSEMAFVWQDENVTLNRNITIYWGEIRHLGLQQEIEVVQRNYKTVLKKKANKVKSNYDLGYEKGRAEERKAIFDELYAKLMNEDEESIIEWCQDNIIDDVEDYLGGVE